MALCPVHLCHKRNKKSKITLMYSHRNLGPLHSVEDRERVCSWIHTSICKRGTELPTSVVMVHQHRHAGRHNIVESRLVWKKMQARHYTWKKRTETIDPKFSRHFWSSLETVRNVFIHLHSCVTWTEISTDLDTQRHHN